MVGTVLGQLDARRETAERIPWPLGRVVDPIDAGTERVLEIERDPEIWRRCGRPRPSKRGTGYAQDDERGTPNGERASNHVGRALEPLSPRLVAQHHTLQVAQAEGPATRRRHDRRGEELEGN